MVSRSLNEQISLNKTSIYSNLSASRLPATVGRRTGDATFLKGPVSQLRLAQLVAELENSLVAWVGLSMTKKGSVPQLYIYLGSCWRRLQVKNIRCLRFKFTLLFIYISLWDILFHSDLVLPAWGLFLESPGNFTGPKSNIQIEI